MNNNYPAKKKNRLMQGILIGALAGAAVSLLNRDTRETVLDSSKSCMAKSKSIFSNPEKVIDNLKDKSSQLRTSIESISEDVSFISGKVQELKEIPPQVASVVKETKEALAEDGSNQAGIKH